MPSGANAHRHVVETFAAVNGQGVVAASHERQKCREPGPSALYIGKLSRHQRELDAAGEFERRSFVLLYDGRGWRSVEEGG